MRRLLIAVLLVGCADQEIPYCPVPQTPPTPIHAPPDPEPNPDPVPPAPVPGPDTGADDHGYRQAAGVGLCRCSAEDAARYDCSAKPPEEEAAPPQSDAEQGNGVDFSDSTGPDEDVSSTGAPWSCICRSKVWRPGKGVRWEGWFWSGNSWSLVAAADSCWRSYEAQVKKTDKFAVYLCDWDATCNGQDIRGDCDN